MARIVPVPPVNAGAHGSGAPVLASNAAKLVRASSPEPPGAVPGGRMWLKVPPT